VGTVLYHNANPETPVAYTVVGVVEDFHYESLHSEVAPLIMMSTEGQFGFSNLIVVRLDTDAVSNTLRNVENVWKDARPGDPFTYSFMDGRLDRLYTSESQSGKLLMMFTVIAISIACVGLFGLAAYTTSQRTKEIGVRKVLGASIASIVGLLSLDFLKLVFVSSLIAVPLSWMLVNEWLETFAYRVPLQFITFVIACGIVVLFTAITISYQAISASVTNPARSLKEE
jgi:putative ABC transport system permease protein